MASDTEKTEKLFVANTLVLVNKFCQSSPNSIYRPNFLSAPAAIYSCVSTTSLCSQQKVEAVSEHIAEFCHSLRNKYFKAEYSLSNDPVCFIGTNK